MKRISFFTPDLIKTQKLIYEPCGLTIDNSKQEIESLEYGGCSFEISGLHIQFRAGKITPKKLGQFVTFYKRACSNVIVPYDIKDPFDVFVVSVSKDELFGQFVFPKLILYQMGVLSKDGVGGKRAIRVYPSWDRPTSLEGKKTQKWQLLYFFELSSEMSLVSKVNKLYFSNFQN